MELIERDHALQCLHDAVGRAEQGAGLTVLVSGEAGIGKTALVRQLVRDRSADGDRVLWGSCEALFSPRPLGPIYDMATAFDAEVQGMLGADGHRARLFHAVLEDLQKSPRMTLLILEDLHWADTATLDLVKYLARRIQPLRALILLTYRDDELGDRHPLQTVFGDLPADAVIRVPLLPLTEEGTESMARQLGADAHGIFATTRGNPFFLAEVLRTDGVPATVRDAVLARAARQSPSVRALLDLVAIVPSRIDIATVDAVLAPSADDIAAALASGLLTFEDGWYAYRHELARIAMEEALATPRATSLHARVLARLEALADTEPVPVARLVHHAAGAADAAGVLKYAPMAAAEAISHGSHSEAAKLYGVALMYAARLPLREQAELLGRRSYQCYLTDQAEEATIASLRALAIWRELGEPTQEGRTLRWLSRLHWFVGRNSEAEAYADAAVALLEQLDENSEFAWALSNRSQLYMHAGRTGEAVAWGTRALELAKRLKDDEVISHALNNVGTAMLAHGDVEGRELLERSLAIALDDDFGEHVARAYSNLISTAIAGRHYAEAARKIEESGDYFADHDLHAWANFVSAWKARLAFELGRWDDAVQIASQLIYRDAAAPVSRIPAMAVLARIRLRRGDEGAIELLDEATELASNTGEIQRLAPVAIARAEAAWLRGETHLADTWVRYAYDMAGELGDRREHGELGFWCWKLGEGKGGYEDPANPYTMQRRGDWRSAAATWARLGNPFMHAMALWDGDEASKLEALAIFEALGASAIVNLCRGELRQAGVRGITRGPRATTAANPAGLTTRERHVMGLLGKGLSNAEIAQRIVRSEKTVEHHISAILRKLGVGSRGEAVAAAWRLGLMDEN
ncbi:AAA family ATPase [Luteibacter aegosomaticola]|uniref:ATP-binding protein n=1 Tax=Luteibacter aegosomaticola TaxID=2911538 RepID=UPI001FF8B4B1|nr:LuxR family transcriptional regulator [Luteibacter aegosomaticola]UPG92203.1 AAA family ATPase [Luteibacter aegosomaticola]